MRFTYIVRCSDNSLYTWITKNIEKRINEHNHSHLWAKYTKARRPVKLVWQKKILDRSQASKLERNIKLMTKKQKEILIKESINNE